MVTPEKTVKVHEPTSFRIWASAKNAVICRGRSPGHRQGASKSKISSGKPIFFPQAARLFAFLATLAKASKRFGLLFYLHANYPKPQLLRCINHVFKCNECCHIPPHPEPQLLRSLNHVFKYNECYHIPPHPKPQLLVASTMCSSATNVITSHPTPNPNCCVASTMCSNATNVVTSHPTLNPNCCVASTMCSSTTNVITSHPTPNPNCW